jgi:hypothetical protein
MDDDQLQALADAAGVGYHDLSREQLIAKLQFESH